MTEGGREYEAARQQVSVAGSRPGVSSECAYVFTHKRHNVSALVLSFKSRVLHLDITLEIPNIETLSHILALLDQIPNVVGARRRVR